MSPSSTTKPKFTLEAYINGTWTGLPPSARKDLTAALHSFYEDHCVFTMKHFSELPSAAIKPDTRDWEAEEFEKVFEEIEEWAKKMNLDRGIWCDHGWARAWRERKIVSALKNAMSYKKQVIPGMAGQTENGDTGDTGDTGGTGGTGGTSNRLLG